ncbi:single-stranded DNA-binding protein [Ralstonia pseudosolanacearum]|uniref:single-stranded DNA-binding protein n=1 Tax=Ralstonia pseudosolanacearum TaxID=1310165 RepID=UPI003D16E439
MKARKPKVPRLQLQFIHSNVQIMVAIEIIGNLGADARIVETGGTKFVTFNVADSRKVDGKEVTQWYGCNINRDCSRLLPYLIKGQCVFVRGMPRYRIFDSAQHHCKMVAVDVFVNDIQLVGSSPKQAENNNDPLKPNDDDGVPY